MYIVMVTELNAGLIFQRRLRSLFPHCIYGL